jgi:hypothetical protein
MKGVLYGYGRLWKPRMARITLLLSVALSALVLAAPASAAPPVNDSFAAAELLEGSSDSATGTTVDATKETGEPNHAGYVGGKSVWYRWVAPADGTAVISIEGSAYDTAAAVYTGLTVDGLTTIGSASGYSSSRRVRFTTVPGRTYFIAVDLRYSSGAGAVAVSVTHAPPPTNDHFGDAAVLVGSEPKATGSNVGATKEPGEPPHSWGGTKSVWWSWTAPSTGSVVLTTAGSTFSTLVGVYTGTSVSGLTRVTSGSSSSGATRLAFRTVEGATYRIAVDGDYNGEGIVQLALTHAAPPANDAFAAATDLGSDANVAAAGTTLGATREPGEPAHDGYTYITPPDANSVWYTWTAPRDGALSITAGGNSPSLAVYSGALVSSLTREPAQRGAGDPPSGSRRIRIRVVEGGVYRIAVERSQWSPDGTFDLSLALLDRPVNDDLADAAELSGSDASVTGSNLGATKETGEPVDAYNGGSTVWWTWTAPSTGGATLDTAGSAIRTSLAVFTGDRVDGLIRVGAKPAGYDSTSRARVTFRAVEGTTYRIAVDGYAASQGPISLTLALGPAPDNDHFTSAVDLGGDATELATGTTDGASAEVGEPVHYAYAAPTQTVWYRWTAPHSGSLTIRADSGVSTALAAYTGTAVASLGRVTNQAQDHSGGPEQIRVRVEADTTYSIVVSARTADTAVFNLSLSLIVRPPNDDFADAEVLAGLSADTLGTNVGATQEPGEPIHDDNYYDPSVWFTWTAPATVGVTLDTAGSTFDTVLAVYTGDAVSALSRVPSTAIRTGRIKRHFRAVAGVTYRIAIDGVRARQGAYNLTLRTRSAPVNDHFAAATTLLGTSAQSTGDTIAATGENAEPSTHGGTAGASVWYRWVAPADGQLAIKLSGTDFAGSFAMYTGTELGSLARVPSAGYYSSRYRVTAGTAYSIAVHGGTAAQRGEFTLDLTHHAAPANDDLADAVELTGSSATASGSNVAASHEPGEKRHSYGYGQQSVWYSWTSPAAGGEVTLELKNTSFSSVLAVYTGDTIESLTSVASVSARQLKFTAAPSTTYRIVVDSYYGDHSYDSGPFTLALTHAAPPPNDAFADATPLLGILDTKTGTNAGSSHEPGETAHNSWAYAKRSVWYSWTSPAAGGDVTLELKDTAFTSILAAYTGDTVTSLTRVATTDTRKLTFSAAPSTTYRIVVDSRYTGSTTDVGPFTLALSYTAAPANDGFADAVELTGAADTETGTTAAASHEPGETRHHTYGYGKRSVWYRWTAPADGRANIDITSATSDRVAAAYTGDAVGALTKVASTEYGSLGFDVVSGQTYRIAVDARYSDSRGSTITVALTHAPPPPNDHFAAATAVPATPGTASGNTANATTEPGEPAHSYHTSPGRSVWHTWTAPQTGRASIRATSGAFTPVVAAYTGDALGMLTRLASSSSSLDIAVTAGVTYRIAVDSYYSGTRGGAYELAITSGAAPANDNFADATVLSGSSASAMGSITFASREPGEPAAYPGLGTTRSVWFAWTAPHDGTATFDATGSGYGWVQGIFTGDTLGTLTRLDYRYSGTAQLSVKQGVTYRIAIESYGTGGQVRLTVTLPPPPPPPPVTEPAKPPVVVEPKTEDPPVVGDPKTEDPPVTEPKTEDPVVDEPETEDPPVTEPEPKDPPVTEDEDEVDEKAEETPVRPAFTQSVPPAPVNLARPTPVTATAPAPTAAPAAAPVPPLAVTVALDRADARRVLAKGITGTATCTRTCSLQVGVSIGSKPPARAATATAGRRFRLALPAAARKRLKQGKAAEVFVSVSARGAGQAALAVQRVTIRPAGSSR